MRVESGRRILLGPTPCAFARPLLFLIFVTSADAAPITLTHTDYYGETARRSVSNDSTLALDTLGSTTMLSLPQFDPILGTLLSVELGLELHVGAQLDTHCQNLLTCNTWASGGGSGSIPLAGASAMLGVDLGSDLALSAGNQLECSFTTLGVADCNRSWADNRSITRDLTFTGGQVAGFMGTGSINFVNHDTHNLTLGLTHDGFPGASGVAPGGVDAAGGSLLTVLELLAVAYDLYTNDVLNQHGGAYSDAHLFASEWMSSRVTYAFEPAPSPVPEPSGIMLFGVGLVGLLVARRIQRSHHTRRCR